jgi:hypothetical protein
MSDPTLETALHEMEATASTFALRYARMVEVRVAYVQQLREMSQSLRSVSPWPCRPARSRRRRPR